GLGGHEQPGGDRAGDLRLTRERQREERHAVAEPAVPDAARAADGRADQGVARRVEIELRPPRAGQRPLALGPLDEPLTRVADLQQHPRLPAPAGVLALEKVAEEL